MAQSLNTKDLWSEAGRAGAALGLVSGAFIFISQWTNGIFSSPVLSTALSFFLWTVKFIGCIWLMMLFMKRLCTSHGEATNSDTFKFGMMTALLSALIYAAIYLANILFISPDIFSEQMAAVMQSYSSVLDSNSMAMLEKMESNYPQIAFFSNLIYCFLYGTMLSAILSRTIPTRDPFANFK